MLFPQEEEKIPFGNLVLIRKDGTDGKSMILNKCLYSFGSSERCEIQLRVENVELFHAQLQVDESRRIWLQTLTTKPVKINGFPVVGKYELVYGSTFTIESRTFRFDEYKHPSDPSTALTMNLDNFSGCSFTKLEPNELLEDELERCYNPSRDLLYGDEGFGCVPCSMEPASKLISETIKVPIEEKPSSFACGALAAHNTRQRKKKISAPKAGRICKSASERRSKVPCKRCVFVHDDGTIFVAESLTAFTKAFHLGKGSVSDLYAGKKRSVRGWTILKGTRAG